MQLTDVLIYKLMYSATYITLLNNDFNPSSQQRSCGEYYLKYLNDFFKVRNDFAF